MTTSSTETTSVKSAADIANDLIAAMAVADPALDTSIGSVARKIFDVVAEQIAPASANQYLLDWIFSVDSKSGAALDDFVATLGFTRIPARRAVGFVTFNRPSPATENLPIPGNTYVLSSTSPILTFVTYTSAWILKGTTSVTVPVQAVNPGSAGNVPVGTITTLASALSGISATVVQSDATTGGIDAESDAALRERFRRTVFRNIAGTEDMFLGVALEDTTPDDDSDTTATQANVVGPTSRWREQVQIESGVATSVIPVRNMRYVYAGTSLFGPDIDSGQILTEGVHYSFNSAGDIPGTIPGDDFPTVTAFNIGDPNQTLNDDGIYDLDFEYTSSASRNDPNNGITNRVDIWVAGIYPEQASEVFYVKQQSFSATPSDPMYVGNYKRMDVAGISTQPASASKFLQLAWGPILSFPTSLVVGGITYLLGTHYFIVHEDGASGWSPRSRFGIEWVSGISGHAVPANGTLISLTDTNSYVYNRLPADVEERASLWKMVTTDVMVHQAKARRMVLHLAIMYEKGYERGVVQAAVDNALATWFNNRGFDSVVQASDILQIAHNVSGVDNVRFLRSNEALFIGLPQDGPFGIIEVNSLGIQTGNLGLVGLGIPVSGSYPDYSTGDVVLSDAEVPVLYDVIYHTKAQNTYGRSD